ncbi:MAG TPA: heavy-metal-associated domain-containing protein [Longimicrobiales bacterium]|nr:heavy-metal-associated domain-containing protein [Longimicrobiales bacterium]
MPTLLLRIDGLGEDDAPALERTLRAIPGVFGVVVSVAAGCAELDIEDDQVSVDTILARVEGEGYTAALSG